MADSLRDQKAHLLVEQVTEAVRRRRDGRDGEDGKTVIIAPDDRLTAIEKRLGVVERLVQPDNDMIAVPAGVASLVQRAEALERVYRDLLGRVNELENRPIDITPAEPAELQDSIEELGAEFASFSAMVLQHIVTLQQRANTQDARFAELPQVLAQLQRERRAG